MPPGLNSAAEPAQERLDVVDAEGRFIDIRPRSVVHAQGLWHQVFHCLVVRSAPPARVLLQRRRRAAGAFANLLDISVAGHLAAGERPLDGVREIREELGLAVDPARLIFVGQRRIDDDSGEGANREIAHVYLLVDDTPLTSLRLDPNEVEGFVEVTIADLRRILTVPGSPVTVPEVTATGEVRSVRITSADLVPDNGSSWASLMSAAANVINDPSGSTPRHGSQDSI